MTDASLIAVILTTILVSTITGFITFIKGYSAGMDASLRIYEASLQNACKVVTTSFLEIKPTPKITPKP